MKIEFISEQGYTWHKPFKLCFENGKGSSMTFSLEFREAFFGCNCILVKGVRFLEKLSDTEISEIKKFLDNIRNWDDYGAKRPFSTLIAQLGDSHQNGNHDILVSLGFTVICDVTNAAHRSTQERQKLYLFTK